MPRRRRLTPFEMLFMNDGFFRDAFDDFYGDAGDTSSQQRAMHPREELHFEKYLSNDAQELIQKAAQLALQQFGRNEVDTEHLLLSLLESPVVQSLLQGHKISVDDVKGFINYNAPKEQHKDLKELSISPRLKNVLELALRLALEIGHNYIGPEHLLWALVTEEDGLAGEILRKAGLTKEMILEDIAAKMGGRGGAMVGKVSITPTLDTYGRDITAEAKAGKLDPVIGRAEEIETAIEILSRRTKNNPVLIGEPGVGKTAIVEGLAQRIVNDNVPEPLMNKRVVELSINALVAGSKYRGEFEERMKNLLDEITKNQDKIVLFIDEIHTIMGAGSTGGEEGSLSAANIMKPMLARGELHLIGATTLNEYQRYIEKDAALERRFQPVFVSEPTMDQTIEILRGLRDKYEAHHKVKITDEAIVAAVELSSRYIQNRFLPDKAVDLIDQSASRVRIQSLSHSKEFQQLSDRIIKLSREREYAEAHKDSAKAEQLDTEIKALTEERDKLKEKWRLEKGVSTPEVGVEHVAEIVAKLTGIPVTELTQEEKDKLLQMEEKLHEKIISQDEAVRAVSNAIRVARAGLNVPNRPQATFLFLGPTGVGKTELVKALAWHIFGSEDAVVRLDMSEYMERHAVARLIGAPPGYIGYEQGGQLTEQIRRRPYAVILLDEIEKAHPDVYNILLQIFDEGRLTDSKGRVVNFTNTIIIATSNIGAEIIQENMRAKDKKPYPELKNELMNLLRSYFRPEFLNRIDEVIVFEALTKEDIKAIVRLQLERLATMAKGQGVTLEFTDTIIDYLAEVGFMPEYGARELKRKIKTELEHALAKKMLQGDIKEGQNVKVSYDKKKKEVVFV